MNNYIKDITYYNRLREEQEKSIDLLDKSVTLLEQQISVAYINLSSIKSKLAVEQNMLELVNDTIQKILII